MSRTPGRARGALAGAVLFGAGTVGGNALVQVSVDGWPDDAARLTDPATYRLASLATVAAAAGVLLLVAVTLRCAPVSRVVAAASGAATAASLLLLAGVRYAAPDLGRQVPQEAGPLSTAAASGCAFAAFVALGGTLLAAPGPAGPVRWLGRTAGGCCLLGPLASAVVSALDTGAGYGVALASTAVGVLLVTGWGLSLAAALRRP